MADHAARRAAIEERRRRIKEKRQATKDATSGLLSSSASLPKIETIPSPTSTVSLPKTNVSQPPLPKPPSSTPPAPAEKRTLECHSQTIFSQAPALASFAYQKETQTETTEVKEAPRPVPAAAETETVAVVKETTEPRPGPRALSIHSAEVVMAEPSFKAFLVDASSTVELLMGANRLVPKLSRAATKAFDTDTGNVASLLSITSPALGYAGLPVAAITPAAGRPDLVAASYATEDAGLVGSGAIGLCSTLVTHPEKLLTAPTPVTGLLTPTWQPGTLVGTSATGATIFWDLKSTSTLHESCMQTHQSTIGLAQTAHDGRNVVVTAADNGQLSYWNTKVLTKPVSVFTPQRPSIAHVEAAYVSAVFADEQGSVFGMTDGTLLAIGQDTAVEEVAGAITPVVRIVRVVVGGKRLLASIGTGSSLAIWDRDSLHCVHTIDLNSFVSDLVAVPDTGSVVVTTPAGLSVIDVASGAIDKVDFVALTELQTEPTVLCWVGDQDILAVGCGDGHVAFVRVEVRASEVAPAWMG
ncbi:cytoplasmic dynein 1 intermediate chain-like isoform 3 [Carpediemonas membranifera]|uniref:Cytoplasmic dynein 1 intermediate chain-like isoform 3 n=1 Tax=Carpediemonas membranifera TaxID=201153 RepID=A0A8J6E7S2_9EUKA|nr:cytoplasmic dynein 1 intermediate chain-like isoform 3 [Carpediemonas membranifera]|eukprot:KAG9391015.1 cytoplasmic dynein 1 intermediate chain-like isoform 3 [Carpediemonas membranifera]